MRTRRTLSDISVDEVVLVDPDSDDWRDAPSSERSEEARINEADDESVAVVERDEPIVPADADEADVLEQHQPVADDDEEDAHRVSSTAQDYE